MSSLFLFRFYPFLFYILRLYLLFAEQVNEVQWNLGTIGWEGWGGCERIAIKEKEVLSSFENFTK